MKPDFSKYTDGLIPVIVQDNNTKIVLMLGYMNEAAYQKTQEENRIVFFSRSKQRLWLKGEISGNHLFVKEILTDCDNDCLLIKASPAGPVCHTGADTCFAEKNVSNDFLYALERIVKDRKNNPVTDSYTSSLFQKGINTIAQKVGEEAIELIIEAKDTNDDKFKNEAADLLYHYMVLLSAREMSLSDIINVLEARHAK